MPTTNHNPLPRTTDTSHEAVHPGPLTQPTSPLNPLARALLTLETLSSSFSATTSVKIAQAIAWGYAYETQAFAEGVSNVPAHEVRMVGEGRRNPVVLPASIHNMFSSTDEVLVRVMGQVKALLKSDPSVEQEAAACLEEQCFHISQKCLLTQSMVCSERVANLPPAAAHAALFDATQCVAMLKGASGSNSASNISTKHWGEWCAGLSVDHLTVRQVLDTLPGIVEASLPKILFRIEDPESPERFPGAIKLAGHDILHVLLGAGLVDQAEAFVVGATMGSAREKLLDRHVIAMCQVFSRAYPEPYSVSGAQLHAFRIAVDAFRNTGVPELFNQDLSRMIDYPIGILRSRLGISREKLTRIYAAVVAKTPNSYESVRLGLMLFPV